MYDELYAIADHIQTLLGELPTARNERRTQIIERLRMLAEQLDDHLEIISATQTVHLDINELPAYGWMLH